VLLTMTPMAYFSGTRVVVPPASQCGRALV
jgi:hypothetical protein